MHCRRRCDENDIGVYVVVCPAAKPRFIEISLPLFSKLFVSSVQFTKHSFFDSLLCSRHRPTPPMFTALLCFRFEIISSKFQFILKNVFGNKTQCISSTFPTIAIFRSFGRMLRSKNHLQTFSSFFGKIFGRKRNWNSKNGDRLSIE